MRTTRELFEYLLQDLYSAEQVQLAVLQRMARESTREAVKQVFIDHHEQTQYQIVRLEHVFGMMGKAPGQGQCATLDGLMEDKQAFDRRRPAAALLDSYNLIIAVKAERLEISLYESLVAHAQEMGVARVIPHLQANLREESEALRKLLIMNDTQLEAGQKGADDAGASSVAGADYSVAARHASPRELR